MNHQITILALLLTSFACASATANTSVDTALGNNPDDAVARTRPNAVALELLGRGGLYSVQFDRTLNDVISVGAGLSYFQISDSALKWQVATIPIFANFYTNPGRHRLFGTIGGDVVLSHLEVAPLDFDLANGHAAANTLSDNSSDNWAWTSTGVLGTAGGGYEFRASGGFLFRVAAYVLFSTEGALPFGGLSFGGTF